MQQSMGRIEIIMMIMSLAVLVSCSAANSQDSSLPTDDQTISVPSENPPVSQNVQCDADELTTLENQMRTALMAHMTDHSFYVELRRPAVDGRIFKFNRNINGLVDENSMIQSASTAKMVTAVMVLDVISNPQLYPGKGLVNGNPLTLDSLAREFLINSSGGTLWRTRSGALPSSNRLYDVTLRHLLSFTSGLEIEKAANTSGCIGAPQSVSTHSACITELVDVNVNRNLDRTAPRTFYYSGAHLYVASLMAVKAAGVANVAELFKLFKANHSVFQGTFTPSPSATTFGVGAFYPFSDAADSPNPAGALRYRAGDYAVFMDKLISGKILNEMLLNEMLSDQTGKLNAGIEYSPLLDDNEDWHYGLGLWNECEASVFSATCFKGRYSSPGSFGSYPFIDSNSFAEMDYPLVGFIGRGGNDIGTGSKGLAIYRSLRVNPEDTKDLAQMWAANRCD